MQYRRSFSLLYLLCLLVLVIFLVVFTTIRIESKFGFLDFLFREESLMVSSKITYMEGRNIFYTIKNKRKETVTPDTRIERAMTLQTGDNSYLGFYIRDHGHYLVYPNSILFIDEIENYQVESMKKESRFNLERGIIYMDVNFLSSNSRLVMETPNTLSMINKGTIYIDKRDDFKTTIYCTGGELFYRPYSTKFELFKEKKTYVITTSIERLLNTSNILRKNEYSIVKYNMQIKLDNLLNQIYESSQTGLINKEYITSSLQIPKRELQTSLPQMLTKPVLYGKMDIISTPGRVSLTSSSSTSMVLFDDSEIPSDSPVLFELPSGLHLFAQVEPFTTIMHRVNVKENETSSLDFPAVNGIDSVAINGIRQFYYPIKNEIEGLLNSQLVRVPEVDITVKSLQVKHDIRPQELFLLLNEPIQEQEGVYDTGVSYSFSGKTWRKYAVYFTENGNTLTIAFSRPQTLSEIVIMCNYKEEYYTGL
jgi:hypothetical protein